MMKLSRSRGLWSLCLLLELLGIITFGQNNNALTSYDGDATGWNNAQKIVVDGDNRVHLVYQYSITPAQDEDLFVYAHSDAAGGWESAEYQGRWPTLGLDSETGAVWLAFVRRGATEDQLRLVRLTGPRTERLIARSKPHSLFYPAIAVYKNLLYLVWEAHRDGRSFIEYTAIILPAPDRGPDQVVIETVAESEMGLYFPSLAVGPDGPHIVYEAAYKDNRAQHWIVHAWRGPNGWQQEPVSEPGQDAHYPMLDYDQQRGSYELVFVAYTSGGNTIYYRARARQARGWGPLRALSRGLKAGYWTFPVIEDGVAVWGRTVSAGCSVGPLYYSHFTDSSWGKPQALEGEFAAFPHLFREGNTWHLIWTDRDPKSPIWRVISYRRLRF